jgi:ArsR family metal-binding transcriptional regulator
MVDKDVDGKVAADIYVLLPGRNCDEKSPCGLPKCVLFAKALLNGTKNVYNCPYMEDDDRQSVILILDDYFR